MKKKQGFSLLELILAVSVLSFVLFGTGVIFLSLLRTTSNAQTDIQSQAVLGNIFEDLERNLRDIKVDPSVGYCNDSGSGPGTGCHYGSPSVHYWLGNDYGEPKPSNGYVFCNFLWFMTSSGQKMMYRFRYFYGNLTGPNADVRTIFLRCLVDDNADEETGNPCGQTEKPLGFGMLPYADRDLNADGTVTSAEIATWNACFNGVNDPSQFGNTYTEANCENNNVNPVFKYIPEKNMLQVALRGGQLATRSRKGNETAAVSSGVIKTFYISGNN